MHHKRFRIISKTGFARDTRVFFIDEKTNVNQEISGALKSVTIEPTVDELNKAKITMEAYVDYEIDIAQNRLILNLPSIKEEDK